MKYIDKLSDKEWDEILKPAHFTLDTMNSAGSPLPYVDKGIDEDGNEASVYLLHVLDTDPKANFIKYLMFRTGAGMIPLMNSAYDTGCDLIAVDDYSIRLLMCNIFEGEEVNGILQSSFTSFMKNKFPEYTRDYDMYLDSLDYGMDENN